MSLDLRKPRHTFPIPEAPAAAELPAGAAESLELAATLAAPSRPAAQAIDPGKADDAVSVTLEQPGRYGLRGEYGRGGIGRVLIAFDEHTGREIALKELLVDEPGTESGGVAPTSARFLREARITAQLEHPNIVPVYEVGRSREGRLYYTMRLVRGRTLAAALAECRDLDGRLKSLGSFWDVCNAISFAHSRGVVHRDIKPQNVMVGAFGETVVLDWGLAKVRGQKDLHGKDLEQQLEALQGARAGETIAGCALGTPEYMSPEQARGDLEEIDDRSDVWGLGAVLYEILTGTPPFSSASPIETLNLVMSEPVRPVLQLCPDAPPELAAIAERALQKDRKARYGSSKEMTDDIAAYMTGRRVRAYHYSSWELLRRFAAQNKPAIVAAAAALAVILGALAAVTVSLRDERRARAQEHAAREQALAAEAHEHEERLKAHFHLAEAYLEKANRLAGEKRFLSAAVFSAASLVHNPAHPASPHATDGFSARFPEAEAARVAAGSQLYLSRSSTFARLETELRLPTAFLQVDLSRDGRMVAAASEPEVLLLEPGKPARTLSGHFGKVIDVVFSPDGKLLASVGDDGVILWDVATGTQLRRLIGHTGPVLAARFSPDGARLATSGVDRTARLWSVETGASLQVLPGHADRVTAVAFSPDGERLATGSDDKTVRVWSPRSGQPETTLHAPAVVGAVAFSHDGERIAVGTGDGAIQLWPAAGGEPLTRLAGHGTAVIELAFTPDGRRLVSAGWDRTVRIWDAQSGRAQLQLDPRRDYVRGLGLSADGTLVANADLGGTVQLWRLSPDDRVVLEAHTDAVYSLAVSPDGKRLATGGWDRAIYVWDLATRRPVLQMQGHGDAVTGLAYDSHGERLVSVGRDGLLRGWSARAGEPVWTVPGMVPESIEISSSRDGQLVVSVGADYGIQLRRIEDGALVRTLRGHTGRVRYAFFSPDGARLLSGGFDKTARLWDVSTGAELRRFEAHTDWVSGGAFSPDGRLIATGAKDRQIILWDPESGREIRRLLGHTGWVNGLAFSPDGQLLVSVSDDATARLWSLADGGCRMIIPTVADAVIARFLPDGTLVLADGNDVRLFPLDFSVLAADPKALLEQAEKATGMRLTGFELTQPAGR